MRIIPGNTKVKIELFKGISLWDLLVGAIAAIMLALIVVSTLPYKLVFVVVHLFITILLLARLDGEPNYMYLLHIIRHFGFKRNFKKSASDTQLFDRAKRDENSVKFDELFPEKAETGESAEASEGELFPETKEEIKARKKREKAEYKADTKRLKSGKLTKEEEDAIWLKRAKQSQAKSKAKAVKKKKNTKWSEMEELSSFTGIKDGFIHYGNKYYGAAIEIQPVEFRFFSEFRRNNSIERGIGSILRSLHTDYSMNIVKIERPISYDEYLDLEYKKLDELRLSYEQGFLKEDELQARVAIVYDRIYDLIALKENNRVVVPFYYLVLFDSDKKQLNYAVNNALDSLRVGEMSGHRLSSKELAVFLKYTNDIDFEETDVNKISPEDYATWAMPDKVQFTSRNTIVNGVATHNMRTVVYPTVVWDAWLATLMSYPSSKVVVKMKPMDSGKAISAIDRSLSELRVKVSSARTDSEALEAQRHLETLQLLLSSLQAENEVLLDVNIYVTAYDAVFTNDNPKLDDIQHETLRTKIVNMKKQLRRVWQEAGFRLNNMEFNQALAYIGSQISGYDPLESDGRGIPSNTVAAMYPWVFPFVMDKGGVKIGTNEGAPVFIDFFKRDEERVNSNMVIVGKSGSGKSFATKALLSHLAADDSKIFILDPEDEYRALAKNLNGKFINVANSTYGRLNPFHIFTTLEDDESEGEEQSSYAIHLQFLEEFFKQILPDCDRDALEYLNAMIDRVYQSKGITPYTDLSKLKPEDYPIFDDLYEEILREFQRTDSEYIKSMLRTLMNYISKFSEGGRNAVIWNGPSSVTTEENFTVFNFQSLLANRNTTVANAQMLLVLKYIDNEIMKNRDYNEKYGLNRKIVVVIDEAHVFIDTKFPVALDFMFQLAKRIRKYNGMQIVITQNIKDFVGSEEIARKSTAIINACQYSFIFALSPNDMDDLCKLYEKAGGINESEQEEIVQASRGQAFAVMSPTSRTTLKVTVPDNIHSLFSSTNFTNPYFEGLGGDKNWSDYIKDSTEKRAEILAERKSGKVSDADIESVGPILRTVTLDEISEEEFEQQQRSSTVSLIEEIEEPQGARTSSANVILQPEPTFSRTEEMLAELTLKLGSESMINEIQKAVRAELDKELQNRPIAQAYAAAPTAAPSGSSAQATSTTTPFASESSMEINASEEDDFSSYLDNLLKSDSDNSESSDNDVFSFSSMQNDDAYSNETDTDEDDDDSKSLGNIFDFAKLADLDDIDGDDVEDKIMRSSIDEDTILDEDGNVSDDDDSDDFDIMAFLAQQADEIAENSPDSTIDDFINGTETVVDVTLEQLISYNRKAKK